MNRPELDTVELLSPARNADIGIEAVRHGADAVYIGAERFGARAAAGNSVADIERLTLFAHRYGARVFVTINTLMDNRERDEAQRLSWQLYEAGADAFIIQDTRFALMDLPPVELHASTQCDIRTIDRVRQLRELGFCQMVLARELSVDQIRCISQSTDAVIETFVHGALCVCYSGRCFMSEAVTGRSANRGECAQMCRLPYDLLDDDGRVMLRGRHLLSLRDLDATQHISALLDAGVRCLKIEGRLKDMNYVKNITAWYRQRLDEVLEGRALRKRSLGDVTYTFCPDVHRTFYRGGTDYFLSGSRPDSMCTMVTGKAMGEPLTEHTVLHNGDGVCWVRNGELQGCMIDGSEHLPRNVQLYRNNDIEFERILSGVTAVRKIAISIVVSETPDGFCLTANGSEATVVCAKEEATNVSKVLDTWRTTLSKTGDTEFRVDDITLEFSHPWFVPVSRIAEFRRLLVDAMRQRISSSIKTLRFVRTSSAPCNVAEYGKIPVELMRCRYCIRHEIGECLRSSDSYRGNLYLRDSSGRTFTLDFDCHRCEMIVRNK